MVMPQYATDLSPGFPRNHAPGIRYPVSSLVRNTSVVNPPEYIWSGRFRIHKDMNM